MLYKTDPQKWVRSFLPILGKHGYIAFQQKNKEQQVLLDKAKELKIDTFGTSMYDRLVEEVAKDRQKVSDMYDHEDDRSGR